MRAEIISIGSEITSGQNLDTNSQWLSRRLAEVGIPVAFHTTVADDSEANRDVFRAAVGRADLVLCTGGLGPTQDDLTREVLAEVAGVGLIEDAASLEQIREMFAKRGRVMTDRNRVQALFPEGATPIPNPRGTAPGVWIKIGSCDVAAMPGVPSEMFGMWEEWVKPRLLRMGVGGGVMVQRKINCFGTGESAIEAKLMDLTKRGHVPEVGITASDAVISLRILARAATLAEAESQIAPVEATIRERLGELVFGAEADNLEDAVVPLLERARKTLATAESVTGGGVAARLVRIPGASSWFRGGVVCYDNSVKINLLGVPSDLIERHGSVSDEVARAMAEGCRIAVGADVGVATVGVAGPEPMGPELPAGLVYAAVAWEGGVESQQFSWSGTRSEVLSRAAHLALNLVRLVLLKHV